jgi:O-antigen ligase
MVLIRNRLDKLLCRWWIPIGFIFFLTGLFWLPSSHLYKIAVPYCLLLPALLATFFVHREWKIILRSPVFWLALLYLAYMSLTAILHDGAAGIEYIKWSLYILLFVLGACMCMDVSERHFAQLLLAAATVAAAAGAYAIHKDIVSGLFWQPLYRLKGYACLYNVLRSGFVFGAFSLFAFWCALNGALLPWQRYLSALIALFCLTVTLLTGSRAPLLALAVAGAWATAAEKRWLYFAAVIMISSAILVVFWDRLSERGVSLRPEIWRYVWQQCLAQPWFGTGLNRYPLTVPTSLGTMYNTHNIFLAVFYQGGIVGLMLFIAMTVMTFYQSWTIRRITYFGALAALLQLYAIIALQFDGVALMTRPADMWILLWLPIALHLYARRITTHKFKSESSENL